jgi:hypothetical protein
MIAGIRQANVCEVVRQRGVCERLGVNVVCVRGGGVTRPWPRTHPYLKPAEMGSGHVREGVRRGQARLCSGTVGKRQEQCP